MALSGTRDSTSTPADEDAGIFARFNKCWYVNVARKDEDVHLLSLQDHLILPILVILAILAKETLIQRLQSGLLEALHPSTLAPTDLDGVTCCVLCSRVNTERAGTGTQMRFYLIHSFAKYQIEDASNKC